MFCTYSLDVKLQTRIESTDRTVARQNIPKQTISR